MGWILIIFINCFFDTQYEQPILKVSSSPSQVFVIGNPQRSAVWDATPTVRVCKTSEVPIYRVSKALRYWEMLGYKFDGLYMDTSLSCMNPRYGEILITLPEAGFSSKHMASTRTYTDTKTGNIVKAKIHVLPKYARKSRVIEHEIGHALGWKHYPQKFHIMHPEWQLGGLDSRGLRK